MSITLYSGTPGSGKSYHASLDVWKRFKSGGGLIANFPLTVPDGVHPAAGFRLSYWDNSEITPQRLIDYAAKYHAQGIEGQTLLIVDEAQILWNSRDYSAKNRMDWVRFFSQHRKLGFNILMIAQNDRMLDRQIRALIETEVRHRKLNNYGFGGGLISLLTFNSTWFIAIEYWYGGNKLKLGSQIFRFRSNKGKIYDSYKMFNDSVVKDSHALQDPLQDPDINLQVFDKKSRFPLDGARDRARSLKFQLPFMKVLLQFFRVLWYQVLRTSARSFLSAVRSLVSK